MTNRDSKSSMYKELWLEELLAYQPQSLILQNWQVVSYLNQGTFSRIFKIVHRETGRQGVLKFVPNPIDINQCSVPNSPEDAFSQARFAASKQEAEIMSLFRGEKNIIQYLQEPEFLQRFFQNEEGQTVGQRAVLICMPLYKSHKVWLPLVMDSQAGRLRLGMEIAQALMSFEEKGVYHRDIKPGNILMDDECHFYLSDVGEAKLESEFTTIGFHGTRPYMAPEVYEQENKKQKMHSDHRSDIYSLGIILYKLFNRNQFPFLTEEGSLSDEATANYRTYQQKNQLEDESLLTDSERARRLRYEGFELPPPCDASPQLAQVVLRACAYHREDRYQKAADLYEALRCCNKGIPLPPKLQYQYKKLKKSSGIRKSILLCGVIALLVMSVILLGITNGQHINEWYSEIVATATAIPTPTFSSIPTLIPTSIPTSTPTSASTPTPKPVPAACELTATDDGIQIIIPSCNSDPSIKRYDLMRKDKAGNVITLHSFNNYDTLLYQDKSVKSSQEYIYYYIIVCNDDTSYPSSAVSSKTWIEPTLNPKENGKHTYAGPTGSGKYELYVDDEPLGITNLTTNAESSSTPTLTPTPLPSPSQTNEVSTLPPVNPTPTVSPKDALLFKGFQFVKIEDDDIQELGTYITQADLSEIIRVKVAFTNVSESVCEGKSLRVKYNGNVIFSEETVMVAPGENVSRYILARSAGNYELYFDEHCVGSNQLSIEKTDTSAIDITRTLKPGDKRTEQVKALQTRLMELGYYAGTIDGNYSPETTAAVKAFQQRNGLSYDGIAGPATLKILCSQEANEAADVLFIDTTPVPTPTHTSAPTVTPNSIPYLAAKDYQYTILEDGTISIDKYMGTDTAVNIPAEIEGRKVTVIGEEAFSNNTELTSVVLPHGVTSITRSAFSKCTSLTSVAMPEGLTSIAFSAFYSCTSLNSVKLPESVTKIGDHAFERCVSLSSIVVPNGVTQIGNYLFSNCSALGEAFLPEGLTHIGASAFEGCISLCRITLPESITSIGDSSFSNCTSLCDITLPDMIVSIGRFAFSDTALTSIVVPKKVTRIQYGTFSNCISLSNISFPESITLIDDWSFSGCSTLTNITLPTGVSTIGSYAFSDCSMLVSVVLPQSVSKIGHDAFTNCPSLILTVTRGSYGEWYAQEEGLYFSSVLSKQTYSGIISAGIYHSIGLQNDGTVVATGLNRFGECNVLEWSNIVAVAASNYHSVGLKADGTVVATGQNDCGKCNVSRWSNVVSISAGDHHTIGLKADGTVYAVGYNGDGRCYAKGWSEIIQIAAGGGHTVGLKSDGTVIASGWNKYKQCNVKGWSDIVAVAAGGYHTIGVKADGTVIATGWNDYGECDLEGWTDIVAVAAGAHHSVGLKADGTVVAAGINGWGNCNVSNWTDIVAIAASGYHTLGLRADGTIVAVGMNEEGQCNVRGWVNIGPVSTSASNID